MDSQYACTLSALPKDLEEWSGCVREGDVVTHDVFCPLWEPYRVPGVIPEVTEEREDRDYESVYELTLTTTKDDPYELRQYLAKIVASTIYDVVRWEACIELQKNGMPHVHAVIYSRKKYCDGTKIKASRGPIKFPYRYEFKRVRDLGKYLIYIRKEVGNPIILDYCEKKGIPQIWDGSKLQEVPQGQP